MNALTFTHETTTINACDAAHANADELNGRLGAEALYVDGSGPMSHPSFQKTPNDALIVALLRCVREDLEEDDELLDDASIAINIEKQIDGSCLYEIVFAEQGSDYGTTCKVKDLINLHDWFDEEWMVEVA